MFGLDTMTVRKKRQKKLKVVLGFEPRSPVDEVLFSKTNVLTTTLYNLLDNPTFLCVHIFLTKFWLSSTGPQNTGGRPECPV